MRNLKILIWQVHGSYLYYLSFMRHEFFVPFRPERKEDYAGASGWRQWPANIHEVPAEQIRYLNLDCIIFQLPGEYLKDQFEILSPAQRKLPKIYLQHDPPYEHPTNTKHWVNDPNVLVVHVTAFNHLMWDCGRTPTTIIEHGVTVPKTAFYRGENKKGLVVINHMKERSRQAGFDIYNKMRKEVPLDWVGMGALEDLGGLGEVRHDVLPDFMAQYRFFFSPIRYASLGLSICEAMMIGMPVVALATTEMVTVIENGVSGFIDTDPGNLRLSMKRLLREPKEAKEIGERARNFANERFSIRRFTRDWEKTLDEVI